MDRLDEVARSLRSRASVIGRPIPRARLSDHMRTLGVPAVSLAVTDDDGSVFARAWGASPETLFQAASISKPVSAMCAVRLAVDGLFDLDQEVNELLTTWRLPDGDGVTIRGILSHSAGLGVHGFPGYELDAPLPSTVQILDGVPPANTEAVRVVRPPGEAYQYSGGGFTILQQLLEDIAGEGFARLLRRTVLDPLAMDVSTYEQPLPAALRSKAATGHDTSGQPIACSWHVYPELAAAGLWTTPAELLLVMSEVLDPGRVLDATARDAMLVPQVVDHHGLGWALEGAWFQHGGSNAGFRCLAFGSVTHRRAAVVMTNGDNGLGLCSDVMATVAEIFDWPEFLRERTAVDIDPAIEHELPGDYELWPGFVVSIRSVGGALMSAAPGLPQRELYASSPNELFRTDLDASISWSEGVLTVRMGESTITAQRQADDPA